MSQNPLALGWVYFVATHDGQFIKIGWATNVAKRLATLNTAQAKPLKLLAKIRTRFAEEAHLHRKFAHLNVRGEWFRAEPELLAFARSRPKTAMVRFPTHREAIVELFRAGVLTKPMYEAALRSPAAKDRTRRWFIIED